MGRKTCPTSWDPPVFDGLQWLQGGMWWFPEMEVPPKSSFFVGIVHYEPTILGVPPSLETTMMNNLDLSAFVGARR